jgi:hypothetical protein
MATVVVPTPGRIVMYRSVTGHYALPAVVSVTVDNLFQSLATAGLELDNELYVHLKVQDPSETYIELNVPHARMHPDFDEDWNRWPPGSWAWPQARPDRLYDTEIDGLYEQSIPRLPYTWTQVEATSQNGRVNG